MSFARKLKREGAKKEFKKFVKENPKFGAMTFGSFNKIFSQTQKIAGKALAGTEHHDHDGHDHSHSHDHVEAEISVDDMIIGDLEVEAEYDASSTAK